MLIVDNFDKIPSLCKFSPGNYFKFFLIVRKKDFASGKHPLLTETSQENIISFWLVDSLESKHFKSMRFLLEAIPGSRLYLTLDSKSTVKTLCSLRDKCIQELDTLLSSSGAQPVSCKTVKNFTSSVTSSPDSDTPKARKYLIDVDTTDVEVLRTVLDSVSSLPQNSQHSQSNPPVVLNTLNGYHVITDRNFDMKLFKNTPFYEIKKSASTLIAMSKPSEAP